MLTLLSVNISPGGIPKLPVQRCNVTIDGLEGDGHDHDKHINPDRAISLIDKEVLDALIQEGYDLCNGAVGENFTVENVHVQSLQPGDRLSFSGGLVIELFEPRKPCFVLDPLGKQLKKDMVGRSGFLARVLVENAVSQGEEISIQRVG